MAVDTHSAAQAGASSPAAEVQSNVQTVTKHPARGVAGAVDWLEARALFVVAAAAVIALSLAGIPNHLAQDSYLALVAGRIIAAHGIPQHDFLTVMAHGVRWIDQQWLAQLAVYELQHLGGLQLLCTVYVLITGASFALAIMASRALGARDIHVLAMLPLGTFFYLATAVSIRTQGFAYPLFVATLWLLASEVRRPSRRALLVFPMLVLWGNLHGSATLGAGMAGLYGLTVLAGRWRSHGAAGLLSLRGLGFVFGAPVTLLVTPYGTSIIAYYHKTLLNPGFGKLITEWQPITSYTVLAVPLLMLIFGTVWTLGRSGRKTPAFDQLLLMVLALGAIIAVRNITWFGLGVMVLLPATISHVRPNAAPALRRARVNLALAISAIALTALLTVVTLARPSTWFTRENPRSALVDVARIVRAHPATKIFADVRYADWLVWEDPALAGHIAYDTSLENLTERQLSAIATLSTQPGTLAPYSVLLLFPGNHAANRILLARPGVHVLMRNKQVIVATKPVS